MLFANPQTNGASELHALDPSIHWFCDGPPGSKPTFDLDAQDQKRSKYALSTSVRRDAAIHSLQIFTYEFDNIEVQASSFIADIDRQLGRCERCVVEYYKGRQRQLASLRVHYQDDDVDAFAKMLDQRDHVRIKRGLASAITQLRDLPAQRRSKDAIDQPSSMSIYEALSCGSFVQNEQLVTEHLAEVFQLIQSYSPLQVTYYVPGMTTFVLGNDQNRRLWAMQAWTRAKKQLTEEDFGFAIHDPLLKNLTHPVEPQDTLNYVQNLWCGMRLILEKCDENIITHSLRGMECDVFRLSLDHFQYPTPSLRFILQSIQLVLEKAPQCFWESMGAISPTTVIEQIFNNAQYDQFLTDAKPDEDYDSSALKDMLGWIKPFMQSLQVSHQPDVCRALVFQMLERLQAPRFPPTSQIECFRHGLGVLTWTLKNCYDKGTFFDAVGKVAATETLKITGDYMEQILSTPSLPKEDQRYKELSRPSLNVIKAALALECKALRTDQEALEVSEKLPHGFSSHSPAIWKAVVHHLDKGGVPLATAALSAIRDLQGLEKFINRQGDRYSKEKTAFNITYSDLTHLVSQILERINDFSPENLDSLFKDRETSDALVASLFSADSNMYEAGVELTKSISGQPARKEAIGHLMGSFFQTTLDSFSWSIRRISQKRTFGSCPRMLVTCRDVLDVLCDSQDGVLRTRAFKGVAETDALETFWQHQWEALKVIYETTESWHKRGIDSALLKAFCRDTMQFSEYLFDQYTVFSGAMNAAAVVKTEDGPNVSHLDATGKELLKHPAQTLSTMIRFLRLKDEYQAFTAVELIRKILDRLNEFDMEVSEEASSSLIDIVNGVVRSILREQHKAELARTLEANLKRPVLVVVPVAEAKEGPQSGSSTPSVVSMSAVSAKKKRGLKSTTIDLAKWQDNAKKVAQDVVDISDDKDEFDDDGLDDEDIILASSRSLELLQQHPLGIRPAAKPQAKSTAQPAPKANGVLSKIKANTSTNTAQSKAFLEKRAKEIAAKKQREADAIATFKKIKAGRGIDKQTHGEGSALNSLGGVKGKDHTPKGQGMMVSSDSESDSDNDLDKALYGNYKKISSGSTAYKEYADSKLAALKAQGPVKKTRQQRTLKDMRARLAPDLSPLHKSILSWNYFHSGDFPPNSERNDYSLVSSSFRDPVEYQHTFAPLLVLEAWQGFLKSREETGNSSKPYSIKFANRLTVDSFIEVNTSMPIAEGKELGISEADIILMSKAQMPTRSPNEPHCLARVHRIVRKKGQMEINYRVATNNALVASMTPNNTIHGVKVASITPLEREYGALLGLQYYDLCDEIIKAKASPLLKYSDGQIQPIMDRYSLNGAQARAVQSAVDNDAFTLIQGPPGSGKTKTIVAITGALLTESFRDKGLAIARPQGGKAETMSQPGTTGKKLLVCAPSNAAVDELVMRFKDGVKAFDGTFHRPSVIRLGRTDNVNVNVLDVTLEEQVNKKLQGSGDKRPSNHDELNKIHLDLKAVSDEQNVIRAKLAETTVSGPGLDKLRLDLETLKRKKDQLGKKLDQTRDSGNTVQRDAEINRRKVQQEILNNAHIVCATLSGSGHDMFQNLNIEFETVIIDEAAQSIELSALIPLKYGCAKCIMVGDPKQLPPTVLSREAARFQYEQSLFVRMQANGPDNVHLLDTQYRMHPEISMFPCRAFYDSRLIDGPNMAQLRTAPWHQSEILGPYRFFNVEGQEQRYTTSLVNIAEVEVALQLFERLTTDCRGLNFKGKVGVITPYKSQLKELRNRFARKFGETIFEAVEFNTTDAFQGRESDIIIFSCVRASANQGIGFLSDIRRMNVGITRAKSSLWVLGNARSLMKGEFWGSLIKDAQDRNRFTGGNVLDLLRKPLFTMQYIPPKPPNAINDVKNADSKIPEDVEMPDAPVRTQKPPSKSASVKPPMQKTEVQSDGAVTGLGGDAYQILDRHNGLNPRHNCAMCGSSHHSTNFCDNEVAMAVSAQCNRCGQLDHMWRTCPVERCLECGRYGHSARTCTDPAPMPKGEKMRVREEEQKHKAYLARIPGKARKRQLGDHDTDVPRVRSSSPTPPPQNTYMIQKRKRDPSPPTSAALNAPKEPRLAGARSASDMRGAANRNGQSFQPRKSDLPVRNGLPPKPQGLKGTGTNNVPLGPRGNRHMGAKETSIPKGAGQKVVDAAYSSSTEQQAQVPPIPTGPRASQSTVPSRMELPSRVGMAPPSNRNNESNESLRPPAMPQGARLPQMKKKKSDANSAFNIPKRKPRP